MNIKEQQFIAEDNEQDTTFKSDRGFLFPIKYTKSEIINAWKTAKKIGFEMGLNYAKPVARLEQLSTNIKNPKHQEFYNKFIALCEEYNVRISYTNSEGMCFEELNVSKRYYGE